jgi:hypothetical protein
MWWLLNFGCTLDASIIRRNSPEMQLTNLQLCAINCHLQLVLIVFATIL